MSGARITITAMAVLLGLGAVAVGAAPVAPGSLDAAFGHGGRTSVSGGERVVVGGLVALPTGRLVIAGNGVRGDGALDGGALVLLGRRANGRRDASFGHGGRVVENLAGPVTVRALVRQPDGRLLVAGSIGRSEVDQDVLVARLTASGALDPTFGADGVRRVDLGGRTEAAEDLAIQPDGMVVVAGWVENGLVGPTRGDAVVARLRPDGQTDAGFGSAGVVRLRSSGPSVFMSAMGVEVESDGRIVAAGNAADAAAQRFGLFVTRLSADGSADPSLGPLGFRAVGGFTNTMRAMARDPRTGRAVLVGSTSRAGGTRMFVTRLTDGLEPDRIFGRAGFVTISVPRTSLALALGVAVDRRGRAVLAGTAKSANGRGSFAIARLTPAGRRDHGFGRRGLVTTKFGHGWDVARDVVLQGPRRILAAGSDARGALESAGPTADLAAYRAKRPSR